MSDEAVRLEMTRPSAADAWVVWGGLLPSGSLKHLTFDYYLRALTPAQHAGWIEISEGCTALALDWFARQRDVPLALVCSPEGAEGLRRRGVRAELIVPGSLAEALQICQSRQAAGWHWPQQMCNPQLVAAVRAWAPQLVQLLRSQPGIHTVVTGFGTGATLLGLGLELTPLEYRVLGVQPPPGTPVPGLRNYAEQNLGERDLYHGQDGGGALRTARAAAGAPCRALDLLLQQDFGADPAQVCILAHEGVPPCA